MRRVFAAVGLLGLVASGAAAQSAPLSVPQQRFWMHEATRLDQQRLGDQIHLQGLAAAQARQQTQQSLQALEAARPLAPVVPDNYPASSGVRRRAGAKPPQQVAPPQEPAATSLPADAATRGDLPL